MSTQLTELVKHVASSARSRETTVSEVLDGCDTTATTEDLMLLLDAERRRQGLKKYELAERCGVSASSFSRITSAKNSERVNVATLVMIADGLGLFGPRMGRKTGSASAAGHGQGKRKRRKVSRRASGGPSKRRAGREIPDDDYTTVGLREAAVIIGLPLPGLVDLAEKGYLPGAVWEGGRWRIDPAALVKLIQAKESGELAAAEMADVRRRLDVVEQENDKLKGQVKLIESVRELLLLHRHSGGGSSQTTDTRVLDLLPEVWPNHFKSGEPVLLGDVLRIFPEASAYSIEFLASALMLPAPPMAYFMRFVEEWPKLYQSAVKAQERRESRRAEREGQS